LGVVAALAAVTGAAIGAGSGDEGAPVMELGFCDEVPTSQLALVAGQSVVVRMEDQATDRLRDAARDGTIGGVILFPPTDIAGERLASELDELQKAARAGDNPPLLITIDQEGGAVERIPALPPQISPFTIAQNDDRSAATLEGRATGFQLRELGINVNLAPVLDVPSSDQQFMAPRAFGSTPEQVSRLGLAFAAGQRREAVAATAKHFPGLGTAIDNTDFAPTTVAASRRQLQRDLAPFRAAVEEGIDLVMVASASYPALGSRRPAVLAPGIATGLLREGMGYEGVTISDDLLAPGISASYPPRQAALLASRAGVDLLLFAADHVGAVAAGLAADVRAGSLDEARLRESCTRVVALKERLRSGEPLQ
jgi:beta-N-acetylhexosaminidase